MIDCNRSQRDVMFLDELADLKDLPPGAAPAGARADPRAAGERVALRPARRRAGALRSAQRSGRRGRRVVPVRPLRPGHHACTRRSWSRASTPAAVHTELFHAEAPPPGAASSRRSDGTEASRHARRAPDTAFTVAPGEHVLDGLLRVRGDAPYACKGGVCGTCRARLVEGSVAMDTNWALEPDEVERGLRADLPVPARPATGWCWTTTADPASLEVLEPARAAAETRLRPR